MERHPLNKAAFEALHTGRVEYSIRTQEWIQKITKITSILPKDMEVFFGKHDLLYKGEYNVKGWCFFDEGEYFALFTAPNRGATIESTTENPVLLNKFVDYLLTLKPWPTKRS